MFACGAASPERGIGTEMIFKNSSVNRVIAEVILAKSPLSLTAEVGQIEAALYAAAVKDGLLPHPLKVCSLLCRS